MPLFYYFRKYNVLFGLVLSFFVIVFAFYYSSKKTIGYVYFSDNVTFLEHSSYYLPIFLIFVFLILLLFFIKSKFHYKLKINPEKSGASGAIQMPTQIYFSFLSVQFTKFLLIFLFFYHAYTISSICRFFSIEQFMLEFEPHVLTISGDYFDNSEVAIRFAFLFL